MGQSLFPNGMSRIGAVTAPNLDEQGWGGHCSPLLTQRNQGLHLPFRVFGVLVQLGSLKMSPNHFGLAPFTPHDLQRKLLFAATSTQKLSPFHLLLLLPGSFTHPIKAISDGEGGSFSSAHAAKLQPWAGISPCPAGTGSRRGSQELTSHFKFGHAASISTPSSGQVPLPKLQGLHHFPSETVSPSNRLHTSFSSEPAHVFNCSAPMYLNPCGARGTIRALSAEQPPP